MIEPPKKMVRAEAFVRLLKALENLHTDYRREVTRNMNLEAYLLLYCIQHPHPEYEDKIRELFPTVWSEIKEWREAEEEEQKEEEAPPQEEPQETIARKIWHLLEDAQVTIDGERVYVSYSGDTFQEGIGEYVRLSTRRTNTIIEFPSTRE